MSYKAEHASVRYDEKLEQRVLELVNDARRWRGLGELRADLRGTSAARLGSKEASMEGGFHAMSSTGAARMREQGIDSSYEMAELARWRGRAT